MSDGTLATPQNPGPSCCERVDEVRLVVGLEGPADDGAARDVQPGDPRAVVGDRERLGQEALIRDQREARIDHVEVRVEDRHSRQPPTSPKQMSYHSHV